MLVGSTKNNWDVSTPLVKTWTCLIKLYKTNFSENFQKIVFRMQLFYFFLVKFTKEGRRVLWSWKVILSWFLCISGLGFSESKKWFYKFIFVCMWMWRYVDRPICVHLWLPDHCMKFEKIYYSVKKFCTSGNPIYLCILRLV